MKVKTGKLVALTLFISFLIVATIIGVMGKGGYLSTWEGVYPQAVGSRIDNCVLCHPGGNTKVRNQYALDWVAAGKDAAAFVAIEPLDSDGDGFTNIEEINAFTYPGDPNDFPTLPDCTDNCGCGGSDACEGINYAIGTCDCLVTLPDCTDVCGCGGNDACKGVNYADGTCDCVAPSAHTCARYRGKCTGTGCTSCTHFGPGKGDCRYRSCAPGCAVPGCSRIKGDCDDAGVCENTEACNIKDCTCGAA